MEKCALAKDLFTSFGRGYVTHRKGRGVDGEKCYRCPVFPSPGDENEDEDEEDKDKAIRSSPTLAL